jgi:hypothetical protein
MPGYANPFLDAQGKPIADEQETWRESFRLNPPVTQQPNPFLQAGMPVTSPAAPWWADPPAVSRY